MVAGGTLATRFVAKAVAKGDVFLAPAGGLSMLLRGDFG